MTARSFAQSVQCRVHDRFFDRRGDRRLGIDASGLHWPAQLALTGENAQHAVEYFGTPVLLFRHVLSSLQLDLRRFAFVDYGCGKGRVLLLAAARPFREVVGVELAPALHQTTMRNIAQARARGLLQAPATACLRDAIEFDLPEHPLVLYFFNPFGAPVLSRVLDKVDASLRASPREAYAIYVNAEQAQCFNRPRWEDMPRSGWRGVVDRLLSPWPVAIYRARIDAG